MNIDKNCIVCGASNSKACTSPMLKPVIGKDDIKYIVVGSDISTAEDTKGKMFDTSTGRKIKHILKKGNIDIDNVIFTSAVRCKDAKLPQELELCGEIVRDLIEEYQPQGVVCLGEQAIRAVFPKACKAASSITRVRGSKIPYFTKTGNIVNCAVTFSPQYVAMTNHEEIESLWHNDICSITDTIDVKVDLTPKIVICKTLPQLKAFAKRLADETIVAWDFETTSLKPYEKTGITAELFSVAFAFDDGTTYVIPLLNYYPTNIQRAVMHTLFEFFYDGDENQTRIGHNTKFDLLWGLLKTWIKIRGNEGDGNIKGILEREKLGKYEDTSLLCWMNDGRVGMSGLKLAAWRYFGVDDWSVDVKDVRTLPLYDVLKYNAMDAFYTLRLYQHLEPQLCTTDETTSLYRDILLPAMKQFMKIEMKGITIDNNKRMEFYNLYKEKIGEILKRVRKDTGKPSLNPNSSKQLQDYFINDCKYTLNRKTKTGYSTDTESMKYVAETYNDGVAKQILEYRAITKLQSTYIEGMSKHIYNDGRIHGGYNLTATITGRTSSSEPNMQNFPKHKAKEIREIVKAPKGYKICSFDYGQIEARLFAVITGDKNYCRDLEQGYDIHTETALWLYRDELGLTEEQAKEKRSSVKAAVFAIFYGAGIHNIAESLKIENQLAKKLKRMILERYPEVRKWQDEITTKGEEYGYIKSLFGRIRRAPIRYTELLNFTTQSTASDMTLSAMNLLGRRFNIIMMIHDDLTMLLKDDEKFDDNVIYIAEAMLAIPWLYLEKSPLMKTFAPLQVECEAGDNWANQKPLLKVDSIEMGFNTLELSLARAEEIRKDLLTENW